MTEQLCVKCGVGTAHYCAACTSAFARPHVDHLLAEVERLRAEHEEFVDGLTAALQEHGVPAMPSWQDAIDYLARNGGA